MAATGVLPFVRGIDLTRNDFQEEYFPKAVGDMTGLRWLKLNRTNIDWIPDELQNLKKLESLSLVRNSLVTLHGEVPTLPCLRSLNCRHNRLKNSGVPPEIFDLEDLSVVDLSHNDLREVPTDLERARGILVLNLGYNRIESIPHQLFVNLVDLVHLDLSGNQLETLPPQMRRLVSLQTLVLNDNPLGHYQLRRQDVTCRHVTTYHIRPGASTLTGATLRGSSGEIYIVTDSPQNRPRTKQNGNNDDNNSVQLENKSRSSKRCQTKAIRVQPTSKMAASRWCFLLIARDDFSELPASKKSVGDCTYFEFIDTVADRLFRVGRDRKRVRIIERLLDDALPLCDWIVLHFGGPHWTTAQWLVRRALSSSVSFFNVTTVERRHYHSILARALGGLVTPPATARQVPMRRETEGEEEKRARRDIRTPSSGWKDSARKAGRVFWTPGLRRALVPKTCKNRMAAFTVLCYILFDLFIIFSFLIYSCFSIYIYFILVFILFLFVDFISYLFIFYRLISFCIYFILLIYLLKELCNNFRALLKYLWKLMPDTCEVNYRKQILPGYPNGATKTPYNKSFVDYSRFLTHLYLCWNDKIYREVTFYRAGIRTTCHLSTRPPLTSYRVFLMAMRNTRYSNFCLSITQRHRNISIKGARLPSKFQFRNILIVVSEYKFQFRNILIVVSEYFYLRTKDSFVRNLHQKLELRKMHSNIELLYFVTAPRLDLPGGKLVESLLDTKNVYLLDVKSDLFVWLGKRSTRLVRAAALKLCQELLCMIHRPPHATLNRCLEGTESMVFKSKFVGWDDVIAVDFTRTAASVARTGADLQKWMSKQKTKVDLSALFMPRQPAMSKEEAKQLMEEWNEDLEAMEAFVLEGKKFVKLPEEELGHFHSGDCYVFLCRYWVPGEAAPAPVGEEGGDGEGKEEGEEEEVEDDYTCVVYFWQGRQASNMGWLTFTFSLQKKFEALFGSKLQVLRTHQQQENLKFLSHFKQKFVIHWGSRKEAQLREKPAVELFHLRSNGSPICTRCVQIPPTASNLNSAFCYILKVPFEQEDDDSEGIVYVWIGSKADPDEVRLAEELAQSLYGAADYTVVTVCEGDEPENFFWVGLGGKAPYDTDAEFLRYSRLFRCSNEKGYFAVSEKCADFCQDDLAEEDMMILDSGSTVFLWVGKKCSDVEVKLAYKSAQVYVQNLRVAQPDRPRKLVATWKGKESQRFTKCFHGWGTYKTVAE
ncbi:unnamed protein product [Ixodes persulcatus]